MRYKYQIGFGAFHPDPSSHLSFLFTFNRPWDTTHYSANTNFFLGALPPDPLIYPSCLHSIDQEIQISNSLWGFSPRPLIYPSFLHSIDHEILLTTAQIPNFFLGALPQTPFSWGIAPSSPPLSFLFTFNRPWDYYTLKHIFQKISWGLPYLSFLFTFNRPGDTNIKQFVGICTQFSSFILPFYIQ